MAERDASIDRLERVLAQIDRSGLAHDASDVESTSTTPSNVPRSTFGDGRVTPFERELSRLRHRHALREAENLRIHRESSDRQAELLRVQRETREVMRLLASNAETISELAESERALRHGMSSTSSRTHYERPRYYNRQSSSPRYSLGTFGSLGSPDHAVDQGIQTEQDERHTARSSNSTIDLYSTTFNRRSLRRQTANEADAHNSASMAQGSDLLLQDAMQYLAGLRNSSTPEDSLYYAEKAGFNAKDLAMPKFVRNLREIQSPVITSMLAPGSTFNGSQFSTAITEYVSLRNSSSFGGTGMTPNLNNWAGINSTGGSSDSWPVKVTIYGVDYDNMTLSASMEAYDVPSSPQCQSPTVPHCNPAVHQKAIVTYLEGEILDFSKNTFITENFKSNVQLDITYWRKLPPFKKIPAYELPHRLLNSEFLSDVNANYVLMRWKERCFVSNSGALTSTAGHFRGSTQRSDDMVVQTDGCGLTISGFYYVSMRREDGQIEGLYCDPQSIPYQSLSLRRSKCSSNPSWEFS